MPESRFCHEGSTCGIQMSRLRQPPAHVRFGWMSGHYSANSVFSAITGVNEARRHNSIEVFTASLYQLAWIYVTEIYCQRWLSKTSWQNFPVVHIGATASTCCARVQSGLICAGEKDIFMRPTIIICIIVSPSIIKYDCQVLRTPQIHIYLYCAMGWSSPLP